MVKLCFYLISQKKKKATTLTMWLSMIEWSTIKFIKDFSSLKKNILKSLIFLPAPVRKFSSALSYGCIHGWGRGSHSYYGKGFPLILQGGVPTHITGYHYYYWYITWVYSSIQQGTIHSSCVRLFTYSFCRKAFTAICHVIFTIQCLEAVYIHPGYVISCTII